MTTLIVAGLFESVGYARDVCNRLRTEGVPESNCAHMVLKEVVLVAPTSGPELGALSIDPLVFGNIRDTFARFVSNGETVVLVRAETESEAAFASDVLRLFTPIAIEVFDFEPAR
jgi:hypothetical protein